MPSASLDTIGALIDYNMFKMTKAINSHLK